MLLRDLVPPRRRSRAHNQANRSGSNEAPAPERTQLQSQLNPWTGIISTVSHSRSSDRMHQPPPDFCSFSLQHLEAGLHFPLSPSIALILRRLNLYPMQLSPNSIRHIILFVIIMRVDKPTPITEGEGLDGDQISSITTYRYNPKKILVEEILWLAHLTPAPLQVEGTLVSMVSQARINQRLRAQFQAQARAATQTATQLASPSQPALAASSTPDADIPQGPVPIEVGSEETQSRGLLPQHQLTIRSSSMRSRNRPFNDGDFAESSRKQKSRGKSPLRPNLMGARSQSGEGLPPEGVGSEEARNMDVLRGITECWRTAGLDLRGPDHPVAHMEGDKWIPDWQISPQSSVFRTRSGQDSWELYDASCLPYDQVALLQTPFTRMEEHCAHSLIQAANFVRGLTLKCAGFRANHLAADRANQELRAQLNAFSAKEEEWSSSRSSLEARIKELEAQVASKASKASKAAADGEKRGFEAGHAAGRIAGAIEGREAFLKLEEFTQQVREIRLKGVRDFLKTPIFDSTIEIKAADYLIQGFDRCKSQATLLKGFASDFDASRLNPCLDANLQPLPDDDDTPVAENDEFAVLLDEIENL
ncbi:UNVERIFIED_CONTAM: hypothetical protein Sindi_1417700 [Sesamum indicum]